MATLPSGDTDKLAGFAAASGFEAAGWSLAPIERLVEPMKRSLDLRRGSRCLETKDPRWHHPVLPSQGYEHDSRALAGLPDLSCRHPGFSVILMYRDWRSSYVHGLHVLAAY